MHRAHVMSIIFDIGYCLHIMMKHRFFTNHKFIRIQTHIHLIPNLVLYSHFLAYSDTPFLSLWNIPSKTSVPPSPAFYSKFFLGSSGRRRLSRQCFGGERQRQDSYK